MPISESFKGPDNQTKAPEKRDVKAEAKFLVEKLDRDIKTLQDLADSSDDEKLTGVLNDAMALEFSNSYEKLVNLTAEDEELKAEFMPRFEELQSIAGEGVKKTINEEEI